MIGLRDFIIQDPWIAFFLAILGILSIPLTIFLFFKGKVRKEITFDLINNSIINESTNKYEKLKINYEGNNISNFNTSRVLIWNSGNSIIKSDDIALKDKIRFEITNAKILDFSIIQELNKTREMKFLQYENYIVLEFDYLGKLDGVIIEVLHTSADNVGLSVEGTIKGFGSPRRNNVKHRSIVKVIDRLFETTVGRLITTLVFKVLARIIIILFLILLLLVGIFGLSRNIFLGSVLIGYSTSLLSILTLAMKPRIPSKFKMFLDGFK